VSGKCLLTEALTGVSIWTYPRSSVPPVEVVGMPVEGVFTTGGSDDESCSRYWTTPIS